MSFNRRERLKLILGGKGSELFKHPPISGYKGVGGEVLEAVEEREALIAKESIRQSSRASDLVSADTSISCAIFQTANTATHSWLGQIATADQMPQCTLALVA